MFGLKSQREDRRMKKWSLFGLLFACLLIFAACANGTEEGVDENPISVQLKSSYLSGKQSI